MQRRSFLTAGGAALAAPLASPQTPDLGRSEMKITSVRIVKTRARLPVTPFKPAAGSWSSQEVEVANPMSIYPKYKATRSLFNPDPGQLEDFTVEVATDKGIKGYGNGGRTPSMSRNCGTSCGARR
jgi:hypothetical protein